MSEEFDALKAFIESSTKDMVELERILTAQKALAPESGGAGALAQVTVLENYLKANGITRLERFDAKDSRVSSGIRPNLIATIPGNRDDYAIWLCAHLDVVPTGAMKLWESDPWTVVEKDGKIYGRGVEDNQQGLVSSVFAALAFVRQHIIPEHTIKLLFMADEEFGSVYGMQYLVREHLDLFGRDDRILIPDGGDAKGETIEIAEKNIFWLRFRTLGRQAHGSRPDQGKNAALAASELALKINGLEQVFDKRDSLFDPPYSTFQPTMHEANVSTVNIIPGEDVFYADCRINPCYTLDEVRAEVRSRVHAIETKYGVTVEVSEVQAESSLPTPQDAPVVRDLTEALKAVHGISARCVGIGGGTVGAYLRNKGYNCVVWSTLDETAHQPNEYAVIANIVKDAETIAYMAARP